ncbi:NAD-dependent epimerase/dehydratase family protein [Pseudonocardia sp. HH130630-07]|uniref:NAD-dependent epimerase/dehydratase family protein n=1 Tax=Pseudonocardia sp. HH130630-07 TaxID=1690815 RepID=UPI000814C829|nr:NAD(P)-dependent oxidoreductase [Pseudonocardia sp. HH130630-07]ANY08341.1 hypothetical protein AFB00_20990 [Pseudonocardia sp. HH130630-07]
MDERILITGAAGVVGTVLRRRLRRPGRVFRLLDIAPQQAPGPDEPVEIITGSVTDPATVAAACDGVDAVVHLGGLGPGSGWADVLAVNVDGTHTVLEAARIAEVDRVLLGSGIDVAGHRAGRESPAGAPARPGTYSGVGNAAVEGLGSMYHSRFGMDVVVLRLGSCAETRPAEDRDGTGAWLSPEDAGRLFDACIRHPAPGYRIVRGVSGGVGGALSPAGTPGTAAAPGAPLDGVVADAERFSTGL